MNTVLLEARPFRPFKSSEEYLIAMKEDLAEWLQTMYPHLNIQVDNFMEKLETGVALCEHSNAVKHQAVEYVEKKQAKLLTRSVTSALAQAQALIRIADVKYFSTAKPGTFFARDNVSNFIKWCRTSLEIIECLLFESDDLIMRKNEKHVILCLLEVARRGARFGMLAPMLVQMERQIDREIAADQKKLGFNDGSENQNLLNDDSDSDIEDEEPVLMYGPVPQIVTNDLKSLDEMVRDLVEKCNCPTQFPMIRVSEGKYRIGDTKVLIFVRILRNHVMVRVGGGWDTLSHYLDKHDPCRCRSQHRTTQGARLVNKPGAMDLHGSHVYYDRTQPSANQLYGPAGSTSNGSPHHNTLGPPMNSLNRSRSRSPSQFYYSHQQQQHNNPNAITSNNDSRRSVSPNCPRKTLGPPAPRSRSPTPNFTSTHLTKLSNSKVAANGSPKHVSSPQSTSPVHQARHANGRMLTPQHVASIQIPVVENGSSKILKSEATLQVSDPLTDQSDTTSEMSDEGYRSLGLVQDKNKQRSSLYSQNSVEDVEDNEHNNDGIDDLNDFGLRKTQFSQRIYENGDGAPKSKPPPPPPPPAPAPTEKKRSRTNSTDRSNSFETPKSPKNLPPQSKRTPNSSPLHSSSGTWNGRQKQQRPSLAADTFASPFTRNSTQRRSVSAVSERRSSSANTSPTKTGCKLRQELLNAVKKTEDEAAIVQQVQELLKKYSSMNVLNDEDFDLPPQKFNRSEERMSFRSPRKDSRPDNHISRIPAPVLHKAA